jgi:putative spermidine/putrescine transport system permease protein
VSRRFTLGVLLVWPSVATLALTLVPMLLLIRISLAPQDPSAPWGGGFDFAGYRALDESASIRALAQSLELALAVATLSLSAGLPLTWFITRMGRRSQVAWLVFLLTTLTLSDVLIAFSWQVMLSKRIGLSRVLVSMGLMDQVDSLSPSVGAVIACLVYLVIPFTVLILYPALSQLERSLIEAARTLGASAWRAFTSVVLPLTRVPAVIAFVLSAVLTLGSYVPPLALGRPEHWPMAVLIGNAALAGHNLPRAAAMSVLLLLVTVLLALGAVRALRRQAPP